MVGDHIYYSGKYEELVTATSDLDFSDFNGIQRTDESVSPAMMSAASEYLYLSYINRSDEQVYTARYSKDQTIFETIRQTDMPGFKHRVYPAVVEDSIYYTYLHELNGYYNVFTARTDLDMLDWESIQRTYFDKENTSPYIPTIDEGHIRFQVAGDKIYYAWAANDNDGYMQIWTAEMNKDGSAWIAKQRTHSSTDKWRPELQVVGGKIYLVFWEGNPDWYGGDLYTATIGSNIVSKSGAYGIGMDEDRSLCGFLNNNELKVGWRKNSAGESVFSNLNDGWNHVVLVYDKDTLKLYINGILIRQEAYSERIRNNAFSLLIGDGFQGVIDEVKIYNDALSASEIAGRYIEVIKKLDLPTAIPVQIEPLNADTIRTSLPQFQWSASLDGSVTYTLHYGLDANFAENTWVIPDLQKNYYVPDVPLINGATYWWRVETVDAEGNSSGFQSDPSFFVVRTGSRIPRSDWTIHYVDSEELVSVYKPAEYAIDGDPDTIWHTEWIANNPEAIYPHEIQIDLGKEYHVYGLIYLARQDISNGRIRDYELYMSADGLEWGNPVKSGAFLDMTYEQETLFPSAIARYISLVARSEVNDKPFTSVAEINLLGSEVLADSDGDGILDSEDLCPYDSSKIEPGLCGCGIEDVDLNADGVCDGITDNCPDDPEKIEPGLCGCGVVDSDADGDGICGAILSQDKWALLYVDSEELVSTYKPAINAFDGDPLTIWHTEWFVNNPLAVHPHEIQIDLGSDYTLYGFKYLPRQDMINGRIKDFLFYASLDGITWGEPIASGTFPNTAEEQEVLFPSTQGRFIRLVALNEVLNKTITSVAELKVIGNQ